jgi:uncharacterized protein (TIGR00255 family)
MPVYSMTGYASRQGSAATTDLEISHSSAQSGRLGLEIRSVNSRFLDLSFRLSEELRSHEPLLRERLNAKLKRGKVELRAHVEGPSSSLAADPSTRMLQRLSSLQEKVLDWLPNAKPLSVSDAIRLAVPEGLPNKDWQAELEALTDQALSDLLSARAREGARLTDMLRGRIMQLRDLSLKAEPLIPLLVKQQRQRFLDRWNEAMNSAGAQGPDAAAQDRALTEATAFAIRIDVAEELTRLHSHLDELDRLLEKGGEVGKRLDFLIQELHREANTLGSKSATLEMTHIAVDMKVLIEQMREQVQNIE